MLTKMISGLRIRSGDDRGFTMVTVISTMMVLGLLAVGAFAAANGDIPMARKDQDRKEAYEAAQAGVDWYFYQLRNDQNYWKKCADVGNPRAPLTLEGQPANRWRHVNDSTSSDPDAPKFRIEILKGGPNGTELCNTSRPARTALRKSSLRLRVIGQAEGKTRVVGVNFKHTSEFLRYVYFTNWETMDPIATGYFGNGTQHSDGKHVCDRRRSLRNSYPNCTRIQFGGGDTIKGSLHTNDESIYGCASTFGRNSDDTIEVTGSAPGNVGNTNGYPCYGSNPTYKGTWRFNSPTLAMPPGNNELRTLAGPDWTFKGRTCLVFRGNLLDIYRMNAHKPWGGANYIDCSDATTSPKKETRNLSTNGPPNGVIYIASNGGGTCSFSQNARADYSGSANCGDLAVSGNFNESLTIGAENDIIINGNLNRVGNDALLGLIANQFVRIYHPLRTSNNPSAGDNCNSNTPVPSGWTPISNVTASLMSLNHSIQVDNYACGKPIGTLKITGAMVQYFRGTVATSSGNNRVTGYDKDYNYDDLLNEDGPPNFLAPDNSDNVWQVMRRTDVSEE